MSPTFHHQGVPCEARFSRHGGSRTVVLATVFFLTGLAVSAFWFHSNRKPVSPPELRLSAGTKALLAGLRRPVEIRFYSLLDSNASEALRSFANRVEQLLAAYQQQAGGNIVVTRLNSDPRDPNAALNDGIKGFDFDKGAGCYLGLALACDGRKEALAELAPEWEPALESDISRAMLRVIERPAKVQVASTTAVSAAALDEVKQRVPDLASVSLEEASRIVREASLQEFTAAVTNMQQQVHDAEARLAQAMSKGSLPEQQALMKQLQEIQATQTQQLKEIAAKSEAQIDALKQLKAAGK